MFLIEEKTKLLLVDFIFHIQARVIFSISYKYLLNAFSNFVFSLFSKLGYQIVCICNLNKQITSCSFPYIFGLAF